MQRHYLSSSFLTMKFKILYFGLTYAPLLCIFSQPLPISESINSPNPSEGWMSHLNFFQTKVEENILFIIFCVIILILFGFVIGLGLRIIKRLRKRLLQISTINAEFRMRLTQMNSEDENDSGVFISSNYPGKDSNRRDGKPRESEFKEIIVEYVRLQTPERRLQNENSDSENSGKLASEMAKSHPAKFDTEKLIEIEADVYVVENILHNLRWLRQQEGEKSILVDENETQENLVAQEEQMPMQNSEIPAEKSEDLHETIQPVTKNKSVKDGEHFPSLEQNRENKNPECSEEYHLAVPIKSEELLCQNAEIRVDGSHVPDFNQEELNNLKMNSIVQTTFESTMKNNFVNPNQGQQCIDDIRPKNKDSSNADLPYYFKNPMQMENDELNELEFEDLVVWEDDLNEEIVENNLENYNQGLNDDSENPDTDLEAISKDSKKSYTNLIKFGNNHQAKLQQAEDKEAQTKKLIKGLKSETNGNGIQMHYDSLVHKNQINLRPSDTKKLSALGISIPEKQISTSEPNTKIDNSNPRSQTKYEDDKYFDKVNLLEECNSKNSTYTKPTEMNATVDTCRNFEVENQINQSYPLKIETEPDAFYNASNTNISDGCCSAIPTHAEDRYKINTDQQIRTDSGQFLHPHTIEDPNDTEYTEVAMKSAKNEQRFNHNDDHTRNDTSNKIYQNGIQPKIKAIVGTELTENFDEAKNSNEIPLTTEAPLQSVKNFHHSEEIAPSIESESVQKSQATNSRTENQILENISTTDYHENNTSCQDTRTTRSQENTLCTNNTQFEENITSYTNAQSSTFSTEEFNEFRSETNTTNNTVINEQTIHEKQNIIERNEIINQTNTICNTSQTTVENSNTINNTTIIQNNTVEVINNTTTEVINTTTTNSDENIHVFYQTSQATPEEKKQHENSTIGLISPSDTNSANHEIVENTRSPSEISAKSTVNQSTEIDRIRKPNMTFGLMQCTKIIKINLKEQGTNLEK